MNKKILPDNVLVVIIALLMISSATAITISNKEEIMEKKGTDDPSNGLYIDPNIRLTRFHLSILKG